MLAEVDLADSTKLDDGAGYYMPYVTKQTLPPGTAVYLNCGNLLDKGCGRSEDLLLVGRKGRGVWDIRASLSPDQSDSEREEVAISILIGLWATG